MKNHVNVVIQFIKAALLPFIRYVRIAIAMINNGWNRTNFVNEHNFESLFSIIDSMRLKMCFQKQTEYLASDEQYNLIRFVKENKLYLEK